MHARSLLDLFPECANVSISVTTTPCNHKRPVQPRLSMRVDHPVHVLLRNEAGEHEKIPAGRQPKHGQGAQVGITGVRIAVWNADDPPGTLCFNGRYERGRHGDRRISRA